MKYMGSKARHAKEIIPFLMEHHTGEMWYVEPFVGGANMIDKVPAKKRIGFDTHEYLIEMWKAVSEGWLPPKDITEEKYQHIKNNPNLYDPALVGYVGFALSYGGKWWGGWCRDGVGKRNYVTEAYKNALKQFPHLRGVIFKNKSVFNITFPNKCTIYCDPPYVGTTKYKDSFDHNKFYNWCREMKKEGHNLYISEYWMPDDFKCVWEKSTTSSLTKDTGAKKATEKLFILE